MKISARNIFKGNVTKVEETVFSATISNEAVEELELEVGKEASAIIKATSVMIMA